MQFPYLNLCVFSRRILVFLVILLHHFFVVLSSSAVLDSTCIYELFESHQTLAQFFPSSEISSVIDLEAVIISVVIILRSVVLMQILCRLRFCRYTRRRNFSNLKPTVYDILLQGYNCSFCSSSINPLHPLLDIGLSYSPTVLSYALCIQFIVILFISPGHRMGGLPLLLLSAHGLHSSNLLVHLAAVRRSTCLAQVHLSFTTWYMTSVTFILTHTSSFLKLSSNDTPSIDLSILRWAILRSSADATVKGVVSVSAP